MLAHLIKTLMKVNLNVSWNFNSSDFTGSLPQHFPLTLQHPTIPSFWKGSCDPPQSLKQWVEMRKWSEGRGGGIFWADCSLEMSFKSDNRCGIIRTKMSLSLLNLYLQIFPEFPLLFFQGFFLQSNPWEI